jgi:glycosyltransferase involved in cell wall biosynthesis
MQQLDILHNVNSIGKSSFGFGQISVSLAKAQHDLGNNVNLWCVDNEEGIKWASATHDFPVEYFKRFDLWGPKFLWYSPEMIRSAKKDVSGAFDIVHQHGIWSGVSIATLMFSQKGKTHTIIAPHGTLNQWALNTSSFKKKIALTVYESLNLKLASCIHATSENEIDDIRNFGLKNPIAYIENGINEKYLENIGTPNRFREKYAINGNKRILLFLSRITPKKGLKMLIEAINSIQADFVEWQLIIAGIDENNHSKEIESLIKKFNLDNMIKIIGPLYGSDKQDAFAATELFILPSYSEGSPMVILDSLAAGVPVITTKASTWSDLLDYKCGWWTDISTSAIVIALKEAINTPNEYLQLMGKNGKVLIAQKYTWLKLAQKTIQLYRWVLGEVEKPDFVTLD